MDQVQAPIAAKSIETDADERQYNVINKAAIFVVAISVFLLALYFYQFGSEGLSSDNGHWGTFGDFFGGVINPVVGMLTVFLVLHSVRLQRRELRASLDELAKSNEALTIQNFEQTFFSWLGLYREQIAALQLENQKGETADRSGLHVLKIWYDNELNERNLAKVSQDILLDNNCDMDILQDRLYETSTPAIQPLIFDSILSRWETLYEKTVFQLDGSFRTLFRLIDWIDTRPDYVISDDQKWFYVGIVRAQLSWIELVYQYYNGLTKRGEKFRDLSNKYAFFDNLDMSERPSLSFIKSRHIYDSRAFSSTEAREYLKKLKKSANEVKAEQINV